jgi:cytochrome d ubiquinol oxidase subunit I
MVVGGTGAWHLLREGGNPAARRMMSMALWMAALVTPVQILAGDQHGLNTLRYQPAKIMALEGHYQSHPQGAPLVLFGIPDDAQQRIDYAVSIPGGSSLLLRHDAHAPLAGLDTVPRELRPPVTILFWSFRIMVGCGVLMLALGIWSLMARWRGRLATSRPLLHATVLGSPLGLVAVIAGWVTTEVGRQPYTVYGELFTRDSASPLGASAVAVSLVVFAAVYLLVFGAGIGYVLRLLRQPVKLAVNTPVPPLRSAGITPASAAIAGQAADQVPP